MLLYCMHVVFISMRKYNRSTVFLLRPVDRRTAPYTHMGKQIVVADEYFLCLYKVGTVEVGVDSSTVEASARHELASPAHHAVVE